MQRHFNVITEARAMKTIPGYTQHYLLNGMQPKRPRGYTIQITPPIHWVKDLPDDVEGIGAVYTNVGKTYTTRTVGWYLHKQDAIKRAEQMKSDPYYNRDDVFPNTSQTLAVAG